MTYDFKFVTSLVELFWDAFSEFSLGWHKDIFYVVEQFLNVVLGLSIDIPFELSLADIFNGPFLFVMISLAIITWFIRIVLDIIDVFT